MGTNNIRFIKKYLGRRLFYNVVRKTYCDGKRKYLIMECKDGNIEKAIDKMSKMRTHRHKVICVDGVMKPENYIKALSKKIDIFDDSTKWEIVTNINYYKKGKNIPAVGYGTLKMQMLNNIKEHWEIWMNRGKKIKIIGE